MSHGLQRFLDKGDKLFVAVKRNSDTDDPQVLEYYINRLKIFDKAISRLTQNYSSYGTKIEAKLLKYQDVVRKLHTVFREKRIHLLGDNVRTGSFRVPTTCSGGRPRFVVTQHQLERLIALDFSWIQIASILGISRTTLYRRRQELNIECEYSKISEDDIDILVAKNRELHPYSGEREVIGHLKSLGLKIQRYRIRESIYRCDPINTALRWCEPVQRRPYSVPSPNSLWHIDSNLKLVRWGFTIQGAIDGYSRMVLYCKCNLDNKAQTTHSLFVDAEKLHGRPSRVRCDYGKENIMVGEHMLRHRGLNRGSILTGSSTHNTRIERLWKDCGKSCIHLFSKIFSFLEKENTLDFANPFHLYSLQFIYLPRINRTLEEWVAAWNNHPLSSCGNKSPLQMREVGFLSRFNTNSTVAQDVFDPVPSSSLEDFGVDSTYSEAENITMQDPRVNLPINNELATDILASVQPLEDDNYFGIHTFKYCLQLFRNQGHDC